MDKHSETVRDEIRAFYRQRATAEPYATSPDYNLRELEIEFLSRYLSNDKRILDVGCGNGYSTFCHASKVNSQFVGVDFVPEMITAAEALRNRFRLKGNAIFTVGDVTELNFEKEYFDTVISQRCLLNLPSRDQQWKALSEIARVLKAGGTYLMLEGTLQGLKKLNEVRSRLGLGAIPEADEKSNWFSNKFDEEELRLKIKEYFTKVEATQRFGMYFFISRVIHPLLVKPEEPRYDAHINSVAREIAMKIPDFEGLGHVALLVIRK